jgi:hypothetical protein
MSIHNEYTVVRETLRWPHERIAKTIGVGKRVTYRYANGEVIPEPQRRLLRLLLLLRLTTSEEEFENIVRQLQ